MAELQIKAETLPVRCEICHQTDYFDPQLNYCVRCADLKKDILSRKGVEGPLISNNFQSNSKLRRFSKFLFREVAALALSLLTGLLAVGFIAGSSRATMGLTALLCIWIICYIFTRFWVFNEARENSHKRKRYIRINSSNDDSD